MDELADEVAEGVGVVSEPLAGHPPRLGRGEGGRHPLPVEQVLVGEHLADRRDARPVAEGMGDGRPRLAAGRELGPHVGDGLVELQHSLVDELQGEHGEDRLPDGVDVDDRVVAPGPGAALVGPPAHEVHDHLAGEDHVHASVDLASLGEVLLERRPDRREPGGAPPVDRRDHPGESGTGQRVRCESGGVPP